MKNIILSLAVTVIMFSFAAIAEAQSEWTFVMIETAVSSDAIPTSSDTPQERRFYISNVVQTPNNMRGYEVPKALDKYFTTNLVEPMEAKGIKHKYYDSDVQINCGSVLAIESKQDAEEKRAKCIEDIKERGQVNIYSFNWTFGAAKGLETSAPTLIFRGKETPNYQPKGENAMTIKSIPPAPPTETPVVKSNGKVRKGRKN